jgi:xylulokinase
VLFGLNHDSDAAAIGQAVLEGVAFAFADGLDVLIEAGATIDKISVIGGGARSMWWGGVLRAALKRPLIYRDASEVGPGLRRRAARPDSQNRERAEDVCRPPPVRWWSSPTSATFSSWRRSARCFPRFIRTFAKIPRSLIMSTAQPLPHYVLFRRACRPSSSKA